MHWLGVAACMCVSLTLAASPLNAQQIPFDPTNPNPYTLHVYTDLVQLPTLVLDHSHHQLPPIDPKKFSVSLDGGEWFSPTRIRLEGDDPITLAILLDVSGAESDILPAFNQALNQWIATSLTPIDHISIYAFDCNLVETSDDLPSRSPAIPHDFEAAINSTAAHNAKPHPNCTRAPHLWDELSIVSQHLAGLPGRRVLLAITDGFEDGSSTKLSDLEDFVIFKSVTIFGITQPTFRFSRAEDHFTSLCEYSGGLVSKTTPSHLVPTLQSFADMLRHRYILEFPRPTNATAGNHPVVVAIDGMDDAFIRIAGTSVPLPDPTLDTDPSTIPTDRSKSPKLGQHH